MSDDLLDLVRQYGNACSSLFWGGDRATDLFDRIAALIPQQPVQARDDEGIPLWIHGCGTVMPESVSYVAKGEHHRYPPCPPGPWRPLLVGGDPAPEQPRVPGSTVGPHRYERGPYAVDIGAQVCGLCGERRAAAIHRPEQPSAPDFLAAINMLTIELIRDWGAFGDRGDHLEQQLLTLILARDEAHARVKLLEADLEALTEERQQPAEPGPLRLTLPQVPEGAVALIGVHRHVPEGNLLWWRSEQSGRVRHLGTLLTEESDGVTVELAPPPEPVSVLRLRLGGHHHDTVYRQIGDRPDRLHDPRVAFFMGPDAAQLAAGYVALVNGATT